MVTRPRKGVKARPRSAPWAKFSPEFLPAEPAPIVGRAGKHIALSEQLLPRAGRVIRPRGNRHGRVGCVRPPLWTHPSLFSPGEEGRRQRAAPGVRTCPRIE